MARAPVYQRFDRNIPLAATQKPPALPTGPGGLYPSELINLQHVFGMSSASGRAKFDVVVVTTLYSMNKTIYTDKKTTLTSNSRSGLVVKFVLAMHEPRVRFTAATSFCLSWPYVFLTSVLVAAWLSPNLSVSLSKLALLDDRYPPHCCQSGASFHAHE